MRKARIDKIVLDRYGSYLGMEKGCFLVKNKDGNTEKYPLFEDKIGEVVLKTGNTVSVGALASLGFWEIDTLILTRRGKPVATLKSLEYDSHAKTRLLQYEAYCSEKAFYIAKQIASARIRSQNQVLEKYGLQINNNVLEKIGKTQADDLPSLRQKLISFEGRNSKRYFEQIFQLFPECLKPTSREDF